MSVNGHGIHNINAEVHQNEKELEPEIRERPGSRLRAKAQAVYRPQMVAPEVPYGTGILWRHGLRSNPFLT